MTLPQLRPFLVLFSILPLGWAALALAQTAPPPAPTPPAPAASGAQPADANPAVSKSADATPDNLKHYLITDYGAVGDGTTLNTASIQKAIDTATAAGGGILEIPKGTFLSGSIFLKKGVELYLDANAVLLGSPNIEDYPKQMTRIEGHSEPWRLALVNVSNMDHVRIGGTGQLNGNGAPFWALFYARRRANPATTNLDVERARLMFIDHCSDVRVEGISFQDSGFWNLHLYLCHDVHVVGLHINAASPSTGGMSPSTDGIDIDTCQNVTVQKCQISNNDDDIGIKGSKGPLADKLGDLPDENITIEDCTIGDGNGLLTCGSEDTIVRNVIVRNCTITGNAKMLNLKLRPDTPQHYSNITVENITLTGTSQVLDVEPWLQFFDLQGQPGPTSGIDHVTVRNITGTARAFGTLRGNVADPRRGTQSDTLSDFTFENINITTPARGAALSRGAVSNLVFKNVVVNGQPVEAPPATTGGGGRGGPGRGAPAAPSAAIASPTPAASTPPSAPASP